VVGEEWEEEAARGESFGSHGVSRSQATRLAIRQEREEPWRIPQWKEVWQLPKGVAVSMVRLWRDSATHSI
jgi:hypothetical protein